MFVRLKCPRCGRALKVEEKLAGKKGKCPACGQTVMVPRLRPEDRASSALQSAVVPCPGRGDSERAPRTMAADEPEGPLVSDTRPPEPSSKSDWKRALVWTGTGVALLLVAMFGLSWLGKRSNDEAFEKATQETSAAGRDFVNDNQDPAAAKKKTLAGDSSKARTAYGKYIKSHPARRHLLNEAIRRADGRDFQAAERDARAAKAAKPSVVADEKGLVAYQKYLVRHPNGKFSDKAKAAIQEIQSRLKSIPVIECDYQGKTGLGGSYTRAGVGDTLLTGKSEESIGRGLLARATLGRYASTAPAEDDIRVSYGITVRKVPRKLIEVCVRHARRSQQTKLRVYENKDVLPDNWLPRMWVLSIKVSDDVTWMNFNKSSRAKFPRLDAKKARVGAGDRERVIRMNATLEVISPAAVRAFLRTQSPDLKWMFVAGSFVGSTEIGPRGSTSLRNLLDRFDPERIPSKVDCAGVAEEIVWSKELGIGDGTYATLPDSRRILQAWILEAVGFTIGNVADKNARAREKAIKALDEAKAEFAKIWKEAEKKAKLVVRQSSRPRPQ